MTTTDPTDPDEAPTVDLDAERRARIEQLRRRREGARPAPTAARAGVRTGPGGSPNRGATGGRIAAAGVGVASMLGLVAAMGQAGRASATAEPSAATATTDPGLVVVVHRLDAAPADPAPIPATDDPIVLEAQPTVRPGPGSGSGSGSGSSASASASDGSTSSTTSARPQTSPQASTRTQVRPEPQPRPQPAPAPAATTSGSR